MRYPRLSLAAPLTDIKARFLKQAKQLSGLFATVTFAGVVTVSNAQSLEDFKKQKDLADAEKSALDAQILLIDTRKKLEAALAQPTPSQAQQSAEITAAKAAQAAAEAEKGKVDAELGVLKSSLAVPSSGISGSVTANSGAAVLETALLASRATTEAAKAMANLVTSAVKGKNVYILSPGELPDFQVALAYRFQFLAAQTALTDAANIPLPAAPAGTSPPGRSGRESVASIGLALEAATKLLGFFKSDFTVAGSDVTTDNQLLQQAFAGELVAKGSPANAGPKGVFLYALYAPLRSPTSALPPEFDKLTASRTTTINVLTALKAHSANLTSRIQGLDAGAKAEKEKLDQELKANEAKVSQANAALTAYDGLVTRFQAPDGGGATIVRQSSLLTTLSSPDTVLVIMKLNKAGGSNYVSKNLWTGLGAMPFKVAGGAIASFTAFDAMTGNVLAAKTVEIHGGYANVDKVGELFAPDRSETR